MNTDMLGAYAKDKVTGFEGVITAVTKDMTGRITYEITPECTDSNYPKSKSIEWTRVDLVDKAGYPSIGFINQKQIEQ